MKRFGLIGRSLDHSFSPSYFSKKFEREGIDAAYELCPLESIEEFKSLSRENFNGWNVTIPYKEAIIPFLDRCSNDALAIGAVNVIERTAKGELVGHNTDHIGFERSILPFLEPSDTKALILGTGGAAKAVAHVFKRRGIHFAFVSRQPKAGELSYDQLSEEMLTHVSLLVNTTPLGTAPDTGAHPPMTLSAFQSHHFAVDLIYNPTETAWLQAAKHSGARILNGLSMLHHQAEESWKIWTSG